MDSVFDFLKAAMPWIVIGLTLAVFLAKHTDGETKEEKGGNYEAEGMSIGMCLGVALGAALGGNTGIGISLGMLIGLTIGTCIPKKDSGGDDEQEENAPQKRSGE